MSVFALIWLRKRKCRFKKDAENRLQTTRVNLSVNDQRIDKVESQFKEMDSYIMSNKLSSDHGNVDTEELLKLLSAKAEEK